MQFPKKYAVIVVGGGHAGTEAALASARLGVKTLLLTHNTDTIGVMSCNPAIGGIGKSHLVKEVDALGGAMALATDKAAIQLRVLNRRKGPAVRATRAQADRQLYRSAIRNIVENQPNLDIFQGACDDLIIESERVVGVITDTDVHIRTDALVLTTGTFLGGVMHLGLQQQAGGRAGDPPANRLAETLRRRNFNIGRLKTGTPARIDKRSVDLSKLQIQAGDTPLPVMSYLGSSDMHPQQVNCFIAHSNERTHEIIRANLHQSPMYAGVIEGVGPRYCPSIEDKIVRFSDKSSHQIFIEPEGLNSNELYPNGISTSLPFAVQLDFIHSMQGFEQAHITRPGYAIEYDYFDPQDLRHSLESKQVQGLFLAGQINGTTGYEEAAAQGLMAGTNAARQAQGLEPFILRRDQAYIGVLIDDLITNGTQEPYRMFTSRAEYRLLLREDNADMRLTALGREMGLVDETRWAHFCGKQEQIEQEVARLKSTWIQPNSEAANTLKDMGETELTHEYNLYELLKRPNLEYAQLAKLNQQHTVNISAEVAEQVQISAKYAGYITRQQGEVEQLKRYENMRIPIDFDYQNIGGLSNEVMQKLIKIQPATLAAAARIAGVTPAAVSQILVYLKKHSVKQVL